MLTHSLPQECAAQVYVDHDAGMVDLKPEVELLGQKLEERINQLNRVYEDRINQTSQALDQITTKFTDGLQKAVLFLLTGVALGIALSFFRK